MALLRRGHRRGAHGTGNSGMPLVNRAEADLERFVNSSPTLSESQP